MNADTPPDIDPALDRQNPALSVRDAALQANVNERTIRRAITSGHLRAEQVSGAYRISADDFTSWVDNRRARPGMSSQVSDMRADMPGTPAEHPPDVRALIARLESENTFLRETLSAEIEARRRADILVAGLMERLPEIAASTSQTAQDASGRAQTAHMAPRTSHSTASDSAPAQVSLGEAWRRWWRRVMGQ